VACDGETRAETINRNHQPSVTSCNTSVACDGETRAEPATLSN